MKNDNQNWIEFFCDIRKNWWLPFLGVFVLWIVCWFIFLVLGKTGNNTFDAIGSLFSGFAFAGIIITVLFQSEELKLQRKDLELTRKEIKGQRLELEQQNETLTLQRFENSFFSMLSQHNEMVSKLYVSGRLGAERFEKSGKDIVSFFEKKLWDKLDTRIDLWNCESIEVPSKISEEFDSMYDAFKGSLGSYYRSLYRIYFFIKKNDLDDSKFYSDIVRSQLTDHEICLLFLNGLTNKGNNFKGIIEKYGLLNNIPDGHENFYKKLRDKFLYNSSAYE